MTKKTLSNTNSKEAKENVPDIQVVGDPDAWITISKAWSEKEGWMKSTKVMPLSSKPGAKGCLIQVTSEHRNDDGTMSIAESVTYVPHMFINKGEHGFDFS